MVVVYGASGPAAQLANFWWVPSIWSCLAAGAMALLC